MKQSCQFKLFVLPARYIFNMATAEKRKRSGEPNIWDHFIKNPLDGSKSTCRKCRQVVSRGSSTSKAKSWGNEPLWTHFKICSPSSSSTSTQLNLQQTFARNTPLQKDSVKAKSITRAIGMMVVDLRPYSIIENDGFRELLQLLQPRYSMISKRELANTVVPEIFSALKEKIKKSLELSKSGVNFTTDMWKSDGQNREYMAVTAHWAVENDEKMLRNKKCSFGCRGIYRQRARVQHQKSVSNLKFIYLLFNNNNNVKCHMFQLSFKF